ncbi:M56 family metallopeptidase [Sphingorhabdus sp.]|jgi:beta-lactamase regulating signal transducer with metallopeptidase domain|uniref:M56 family metallopeptidase n=1 Tax=Sphingorhabdus sp. TaxID=1902408 RepID=UPI0037C84D84
MSTDFMGAWLFDTFVVTSMLMLLVLLVRRPVARHFGPSIAYALWCIPAARVLMPSLEGAPAPNLESGTALQDNVRDAIFAGIATPENTASATSQMANMPSVDYTVLGLTLWLGGATLFFIIQMIRYASMRDELLSEATEIANINGVSVVASDQVTGPLAFGLFKRYIAVPQDFTKSYSAEERELAIAHEMAHHRSGDLFANLAAFILLCLSWFNPVAWLSWSAFRIDQEAACDARVLAGKDTQDRVIYGRVLARTAFDGVPAFATALNSPKTIIERLRRLNMKNASTKRRLLGKIGIIAAAALVLPLTATVVPAVVAQDETVADGKAETVKRDGKTIDIFRHDDGERVTMVERDGTVFIFLTDKKPTRGEVEKMIEEAETNAKEAETSAKEAETYAKEADEAMSEADIAQIEADTAMASAEFGRGMAQANRVIVNAAVDIAKIDIQDMTQNCTAGQYLSTDVKSFDGTSKARVRRVTCGEPCDVCGKRQAKIAMVKALTDLRAARRDIVSATEMPKAVRKDVMEKLDNEIRELETQTDNIN